MGARRKLRRKLTHVYEQASTHTRIKAGVAALSPSFSRSHQSRGARRPRRRTHVPRQSRENVRKRTVRRANEDFHPRTVKHPLSLYLSSFFFSPRAGRRNPVGSIVHPRLVTWSQDRTLAPVVPQQQVSGLSSGVPSSSRARTLYLFFTLFTLSSRESLDEFFSVSDLRIRRS